MSRFDGSHLLKALPAKTTRDGIPSFAAGSDRGFDERWYKHPKPQPTPVEQFIAKTGLPLTALEGAVVLDAGCGVGRYCRFVSEHGGHAVGVDISSTGLRAAQKNAPEAYLVQGDLLDLPLRDGSVDIAISIGVLHHLSDPYVGFCQVARAVKPGGKLAIWVYCDPVLDPKDRLMVEFFHEITKACPPKELYAIIKKYAVPIRDTYHPLWGPAQQVIRPSYNPDDEQCISDMFDWHTPQYRFHHTVAEVKGWFANNGFDVDWVGDFPVSVSGTKR